MLLKSKIYLYFFLLYFLIVFCYFLELLFYPQWSFLTHFYVDPYAYIDLKILLEGIDMLVIQHLDPLKNSDEVFNYPLIWGYLSYLGYTISNLKAIFLTQLILVFTSIFILVRYNCQNLKSFLIWFILLLSPAIFFLFDRQNTDNLIFIFILLAIYFRFQSNIGWQILGFIIIGILSCLKMYPVILLVLWIKNTKIELIMQLLVVSIFIYFFISHYEEMKLVSRNAYREIIKFYGNQIFFDTLYQLKIVSLKNVILYSWILTISFSISILLYFKNIKINLDLNHFNDVLFITGLLIYFITFLCGYSNDIRLCFHLFLIPKIIENIDQRKYQFLYIILVLMLMEIFFLKFFFTYYTTPMHLYVLYYQVLQWILFGFSLLVLKNHLQIRVVSILEKK